MSGTLVLCGAPIGDVRDASPRLAEILATADVIAAEDTRRVHRLAHALGIVMAGRVVSCYDAVEGARAEMLTDHLRRGATVALITDAGMPAVSDPGFRVVAAAAAAGIAVTVVPGPSAVTAALAVSGLPTDRWTFEGFLPRKGGERRARLRELVGETRTMVFLESPHRLTGGLRDLTAVFGGTRPAVVCRELTKTFEEIVRGDLASLVAWATDGRIIRGEFTLVVAGGSRVGAPRVEAAGGTEPDEPTAAHSTAAQPLEGHSSAGQPAAGQPVAGQPAVGRPAADEAAVDAERPADIDFGAAVLGIDELGPAQPPSLDPAALAAAVARRTAAGMSPKDARKVVAAEHGVTRNEVYAAVLAVRDTRAGRSAGPPTT